MATAMRELTYQTGLVRGFVSTILYLAMIYYLVKFIIIYFKRLFVTVILILLGPLMGIKFAIDRLKFKSSTALTTWAKEYIFSVGTQTIHALVYTIFIGITYKIVLASDTASMAVCILAFMFFRFMTEAEKMLRGFLKLTGDSASSIIGDADSTDIKEIFGLPILARMRKYANVTPVPGIVKRKYEAGKKYMRHEMESEYVKMRRSDFEMKYRDAYMPDNRGRKVEITSDIDAKIDKILRSEFKYKLDDAVERTATGWKVLRNSGQIVVGLPVAVVGNTILGTGIVVAGTHTLYKVIGNKITGYKKFNEEVKLRAKSEQYEKMQKWLNVNATKKVAEGFKEQYLNQNTEPKAKNILELELLHQARQAELNLQYQVAVQKEKLLTEEKTDTDNDIVSKKSTDKDMSKDEIEEAAKIRLHNELVKQNRKKLKRNVEEAMKTVDRTNIQNEVKAYMKANNKYTLSFEDIEIIAEKFDVKIENSLVGENGIENQIETEGFMENLKTEAKADFIRDIIEEDKINEQLIISEEALEQVKTNIMKKMEQTDDEKEKQSMSLAIKCVDDKKHELNGENKENVFSNLSEEEQNKVKGIIKEATDDETVEKHIGKMEVKEIVDTMKKAVDKEGSIKKEYPVIEEFKPIIEEVYNLKQVNELAKETTGKPIYKDISKLVENMINNSKVKLDKQEKL